MESVGQNAAEGGRELKEVASEVKVLHDLVEELYSTGNGMPDHALPPLPKKVEIEDALHDSAVFGSPTTMAPVKLSETDMLDIMRDALRQNRVDLYLQPIVSLPQRKHRYFECFSAVRNANGAVITPDRYIEIAKKSGLIKAIDNMLLFRCIQLVKKNPKARLHNQLLLQRFADNAVRPRVLSGIPRVSRAQRRSGSKYRIRIQPG